MIQAKMLTERINSIINLLEEHGFIIHKSINNDGYFTIWTYKVFEIKDNLRKMIFAQISGSSDLLVDFRFIKETNKIVKKYSFDEIFVKFRKFSQNSVVFGISSNFEKVYVVGKILENTDTIFYFLSDTTKNPSNDLRHFSCLEVNYKEGRVIFKKTFGYNAGNVMFDSSKGFYAI